MKFTTNFYHAVWVCASHMINCAFILPFAFFESLGWNVLAYSLGVSIIVMLCSALHIWRNTILRPYELARVVLDYIAFAGFTIVFVYQLVVAHQYILAIILLLAAMLEAMVAIIISFRKRIMKWIKRIFKRQ